MELTRTQKIIIGFISGFLLGLGLIWGWNNYSSRTTLDIPTTTTTPESTIETANSTTTSGLIGEQLDEQKGLEDTMSNEYIAVEKQHAGTVVVVKKCNLTVPGWVVVHEEKNGIITNALGAIRRDPGTCTNTTIPLLRATEAGKRYWVVLYADSGDRLFNLREDFPIRTATGDPIMSPFMTE